MAGAMGSKRRDSAGREGRDVRARSRRLLAWIVRRLLFISPVAPPDPRVRYLRGLVERGGLLTDNEEQLAGLILETYRYNRALDRKQRMRTIEARVLYGFIAALVIGLALSASEISDLRDDQHVAQANTDRLICTRQEEVTRRLIGNQNRSITAARRAMRSNQIMQGLLEFVTSFRPPPNPTPEQRQFRSVFTKAVRDYDDQIMRQRATIRQIQKSRASLRDGLKRVDCDNLPDTQDKPKKK